MSLAIGYTILNLKGRFQLAVGTEGTLAIEKSCPRERIGFGLGVQSITALTLNILYKAPDNFSATLSRVLYSMAASYVGGKRNLFG